MRIIQLSKSDNTQPWDKHRNVLIDRKGGWIIGQGVHCHGYDLLRDLLGEVSYFQLIVLNATGRLPERRFADWLECAYMCLSWPDPRIWCNRVGSLVGTVGGSVSAGTAAGILAGDSIMYGPYSMIQGSKAIKQAKIELDSGLSVEAYVNAQIKNTKGKIKIMGFARPIAKGDERVPEMERVSEKYGFTIGEHLQIAYKIQSYLSANYGESLNIGGYFSAFLVDQGFSPEEIYSITSTMVASGVTSCVIEEFDKPNESFLPLRCDDINYTGPAPRSVPDR